MSRLEQLITELCPDGVEHKKLSELGDFYSGLTGKTKSDFQDGNSKFISYMNIYKNPAIDINVLDFVKINPGEHQKSVKYGDILFTGSSETPEECGISSVMTTHTEEKFYLNSFCIGFRLHNPERINPQYSKHLFRSAELRRQINKTANGVTRFNISKEKLGNVVIPIPPLPAQEEIVHILDTFTALDRELGAELEARTKQYEFYRDTLLNFDPENPHPLRPTHLNHLIQTLCPDGVDLASLGEVSQYSKIRIPASDVDNQTYVGVDNLLQNKLGKTVSDYVPTSGSLIGFGTGDILIGNIRPYLKKIWLSDIFGGTNGDVLVIQLLDDIRETVSPKYLFYVLSSDNFFEYNVRYSKGAKMPRGDKQSIMNYQFYLPPLPVQEEIVAILDRFDALVNDLKNGLPAEIALRRKQYEYYRDQLLTFTPLP